MPPSEFHWAKEVVVSLLACREMLFHNDEPSWGLVVLLVSKAAGVKRKFAEVEQDRTAGITIVTTKIKE